LRISFESRTDPKTDATKDAVDIGIDLLPFLFIHEVFLVRRNRFSVKKGSYFPVVSEKSRHVDNEVPENREVGKGFDEGRFSQEVFYMGPAGQYYIAIDLHGAGATNGSPAGITEGEGSILLILNPEQRLQ
jgi:hypothetical protein